MAAIKSVLIGLMTGASLITAPPFSATQHKALSPPEARSFFRNHRENLEKVASLLARCSGGGAIAIYADGHVLTSGGGVRCPAKQAIARELKRSGILWLNISSERPYGQSGPLAAMFVLSSTGIISNGSGSAIYYFPVPKKNPFGDAAALDGRVGRWFYRSY